MSKHYDTPGPWTIEEERDADWSFDSRTCIIVVESGPAISKRDGSTWPQGAYKVRVAGDRPPGLTGKTFVGETAWSDAARLAEDLRWKVLRDFDKAP